MNLYLINGFLGSGKTSAIANACRQLIDQKIKIAVVTNDQGEQQVDSAYLQSLSLRTGEISNGCFCCRFNVLKKTVEALQISEHPEIIFAESVGSCTDLVATVAKPFALNYHNVRIVISVFADAYFMHSIMKGTSCFIEESVQYIYRKQLEEADVIVINKIDLLTEDELKCVKEIVETTYHGKKIICMSAYHEDDIHRWIQVLNEFHVPSHRNSLELDYNVYGAGEAMLAWFDQKISLHTHEPIAAKVALILTDAIHYKIQQAGYTIGHLKFLLSDNGWNKKISYTANGIKNNYDEIKIHSCNHLDVLINARVQTNPQLLQQIIAFAIEETMTSIRCRIVSHKFSSFRPGFPKPLHRITV